MSTVMSRLSAVAMGSIVMLAGVAVVTTDSYATKSDKVVICHATNSHSNPYTVNNVNTSSVDEKNNKFLNGHGDHEGGVWYRGIANHSWGDIIPPFESPKGTKFAGQNWNEAGKTIYNNGCKAVIEDKGKPVVVQPTDPGKHEDKPVKDKGNTTPDTPKAPEVKTPVTPAAVVTPGKGAVASELPQTGATNVLGLVGALGAATYAVVRRFMK